MELQILRGTVANIRHTTEVSGNDNGVSTSQVAVFELGGRAVEIKLMETIVLSNGDRLVAEPVSPTDATVPPCNGPSQPATISMHKWAAA